MPPIIYSPARLLVLTLHYIDPRKATAHAPIRALTFSIPMPTARPSANNTNRMNVRNGQEPVRHAATSIFLVWVCTDTMISKWSCLWYKDFLFLSSASTALLQPFWGDQQKSSLTLLEW